MTIPATMSRYRKQRILEQDSECWIIHDPNSLDIVGTHECDVILFRSLKSAIWTMILSYALNLSVQRVSSANAFMAALAAEGKTAAWDDSDDSTESGMFQMPTQQEVSDLAMEIAALKGTGEDALPLLSSQLWQRVHQMDRSCGDVLSIGKLLKVEVEENFAYFLVYGLKDEQVEVLHLAFPGTRDTREFVLRDEDGRRWTFRHMAEECIKRSTTEGCVL